MPRLGRLRPDPRRGGLRTIHRSSVESSLPSSGNQGSGPVSEQRRTSTSNFGVSRREAHDASQFYARFRSPAITDDDRVAVAPDLGDGRIEGDIRRRDDLPDNSVALVVTSPPYYAGKAYEEELGQGHVPGNYLEYLEGFATCSRSACAASNRAAGSRSTWRTSAASPTAALRGTSSASCRMTSGLLLRGEVIWDKGEGRGWELRLGFVSQRREPGASRHHRAGDHCQQGTIRPGQVDAARAAEGYPHGTRSPVTNSCRRRSMSGTSSESARRVKHPAPFPVQLPERLIHLYTFAVISSLTPSWGPAPRPWPRSGRAARASATTPIPRTFAQRANGSSCRERITRGRRCRRGRHPAP